MLAAASSGCSLQGGKDASSGMLHGICPHDPSNMGIDTTKDGYANCKNTHPKPQAPDPNLERASAVCEGVKPFG